MIRFLNLGNAYFSLDDVISWLGREHVLTGRQSRVFIYRCYTYLSTELAKAYSAKAVLDHLVPVILPFGDYFVNWIVWANLLFLLPEVAGRHHKVHEINMLLDDPDFIQLHPDLFTNLDFIPVSKQLP